MTKVNHEELKEDLHGIIVMDFHVKVNPITENSGLSLRITVTRIDLTFSPRATYPRLKKKVRLNCLVIMRAVEIYEPTMKNIHEASTMTTTSYMSNNSMAYEDNEDMILLLSTNQLITPIMIAIVINHQDIQENSTLPSP